MVIFPPTTSLQVKTTCLAGFLVLLGQTSGFSQTGAPGSRDGTYNPPNPSSIVDAVIVQPDGKAVIGGLFITVGGTARVHVARLNADGTLDTGFDAGAATGARSGNASSLILQPDGKILAGGRFTKAGDQALRDNLARLNPDGSVDAAFDPVLTFEVDAMARQPDGKIIVGGQSYDIAGGNFGFYDHVARLNADGTLDSSFTFTPTPIVANAPLALAVQPDGKVLVGGRFTQIGGGARASIARLNANGSLDTSFDPGTGATNSRGSAFVDVLLVRPDGTIFIGGTFDMVNGVAHSNFARLTADGKPDPSYTNAGFGNTVIALAAQPDGKLLVGGLFSPDVVRLNVDGTVDNTFTNTYSSLGAAVHGLALQPDGKIVAGGTDHNYVFRLNGDPAAPHPAFFAGESALGGGAYYLQFASGNPFGYYSYLTDPKYIFHFDLGYEYLFDAADGKSGVYFYDFKSQGFFYTSPAFPFPYLYDFSLNSVVYYYPDPTNPGHYNTGGVRYFYVFGTGEIISK